MTRDLDFFVAHSAPLTGLGATQCAHRVVGGPPGDVLVEGPDEHQLAAEVHPGPHRLAVGVPDVCQAFLTRLGDSGFQPQRADAGVMDLQVPPEQPADGVGDVAQRGVVELGGTFGEVLHQQVPYGPALDAGLVDDLLDAAASFDPQRPEPRWRTGGQHTGVLEQRVEQWPASAAPEVMLLEGGRQLDAVAHGDVADQAAFADHHPGELAEGIGAGPADRWAGPDLETAESVGVDSRPGLGQQERLALP